MDESLQCWSGIHAFYCALYSVGLFLFLIIACLVSLLFNDARPYHLDALTRLDINQEIYITVYRVILTVVSHYTTTQSYQWIILALHFLMSAHFLKDYYKYLHYYYAEISTLFGACCLGYLWVTINAILVQALQSMAYTGQIIVMIVGFIFLYPTVHYLRRNKIYKIMMLKSQDKIKNDIELDHFANNFESMLLD